MITDFKSLSALHGECAKVFCKYHKYLVEMVFKIHVLSYYNSGKGAFIIYD